MWIGKQPCIQMNFRRISSNNMHVSIPGKLSGIHLHALLFSSPCGKVLIIVGISWNPYLRVQPIYPVSNLTAKKKILNYLQKYRINAVFFHKVNHNKFSYT